MLNPGPKHSRCMGWCCGKALRFPAQQGFVVCVGAPQVPCALQAKHLGRLPVVNFAAGGVATPADAALMMQMGMDGVFVGSGIFKSGDPAKRARAIVQVRMRIHVLHLQTFTDKPI